MGGMRNGIVMGYKRVDMLRKNLEEYRSKWLKLYKTLKILKNLSVAKVQNSDILPIHIIYAYILSLQVYIYIDIYYI